jgi:hypothetical protein
MKTRCVLTALVAHPIEHQIVNEGIQGAAQDECRDIVFAFLDRLGAFVESVQVSSCFFFLLGRGGVSVGFFVRLVYMVVRIPGAQAETIQTIAEQADH